MPHGSHASSSRPFAPAVGRYHLTFPVDGITLRNKCKAVFQLFYQPQVQAACYESARGALRRITAAAAWGSCRRGCGACCRASRAGSMTLTLIRQAPPRLCPRPQATALSRRGLPLQRRYSRKARPHPVLSQHQRRARPARAAGLRPCERAYSVAAGRPRPGKRLAWRRAAMQPRHQQLAAETSPLLTSQVCIAMLTVIEWSSCSVSPACWSVRRACLTYTDRWPLHQSALRRCGTRAREEAGSAAAGAARARHWRRCPPRLQRRRGGGWWPLKARMPASGHACVMHALEEFIGNLLTRPQPASAATAELAGGLALPFLPGMNGEVGVGVRN